MRENNFDLLRLAASLGVFFGHGSFLYDRHIIGFFGNTNSFGSMSVLVFFFISGHLVYQSWQRSSGVLDFFKKRFFRIFPGLFFASFFSVFVVGLLMTRLDSMEFLKSEQVWQLFFNYAGAIASQHMLPGVFEETPFPKAVNGSLWTIKYEILMYVLLALFAVSIGVQRWKLVGLVIILALAVVFSSDFNFFNEIFRSGDFFIFGLSFFFGALFCYFLTIKAFWIWILFFIGWSLAIFGSTRDIINIGVCLWLSCAVFFIAYFKPLIRFKLRYDLSYGIYIYAFPIQQAMTEICLDNGWGKAICLMVSLVLVTFFSLISWFFIEKPMISWARGRDLKKVSVHNILIR